MSLERKGQVYSLIVTSGSSNAYKSYGSKIAFVSSSQMAKAMQDLSLKQAFKSF